MAVAGLTILYVILLWWFATGAILYLDGLPRRTFPVSLGVLGALAALAFVVLGQTASTVSVWSVLAAITAALVIWAFNELMFLTGAMTGPSRAPCPPDARGWRRFGLATRALLWHEVGLVVSTLAIAFVVWDQPNAFGLWTFLLLWTLRLSTKLNIFLGVPNTGEDFLPDQLAHLKSYFLKRPMNAFFPFSVMAATAIVALLVARALHADQAAGMTMGWTALASLAALGLIEHWFLVLPFASAALWQWGFKSREGAEGQQPAAVPVAETKVGAKPIVKTAVR
jgi:putative photosynthetic complex assembly protein 2